MKKWKLKVAVLFTFLLSMITLQHTFIHPFSVDVQVQRENKRLICISVASESQLSFMAIDCTCRI